MKKKVNLPDDSDQVTLKTYINDKILWLEEKIELNLRLNQVALDKAQENMDERLNRMNEFRDALKDQASRFITRSEIDSIMLKYNTEIKTLETGSLPRATFEARHDALVKQVDDLRLSKAMIDGKASASSVYWAFAIGIIGILLSIISLLIERFK